MPDRTAKSMFSDIEQLCRLFPKKTDLAAISDGGFEQVCI